MARDVARIDISIRRGNDFTEEFAFTNPDGSPMDITGYTVKAQLRTKKKITAALLADFTVEQKSGTTNTILLKLTDVETSAIAARRGYYDILFTDASGFDETMIEGVATVASSVTAK